MRTIASTLAVVFCTGSLAWPAADNPQPARRLATHDYRDKMKAGWLGQMVGVAWGAPTEFKSLGRIMPASSMPPWKEGLANEAFSQDDLYVEMTFLRTLEQYGWSVSARQAGIDFANSHYPLWHANDAGRRNLRQGIAPPDSGHPQFNQHSDDIDYQIEADFSGLVAPGLPNAVIALGEKFGRIVNYGDGLYGGQFIGAMYAEAFFETDPARIVAAGLRCIPPGSQYAEAVRDVVQWHQENPGDWEKTWQLVNQKYQLNPDYRRIICERARKRGNGYNIDAKINGAYVVMGLLYGRRDLDLTIAIATRCGQDSDCNPSSAAGIVATTYGFSKLPAKYSRGLSETTLFSNTQYTFPKLLAASEQVARQALVQSGGKVERTASGDEVWIIPAAIPKPSALEKSWEPGPIANSKFTEEEMKHVITESK